MLHPLLNQRLTNFLIPFAAFVRRLAMANGMQSSFGPRPLVLCGPSGSGKSTLIKQLMNDFKDAFGFSVSHTTRSQLYFFKKSIEDVQLNNRICILDIDSQGVKSIKQILIFFYFFQVSSTWRN